MTEKTKKLQVREGRIEVSRTVFGKEESEHGTIEIAPFETTPANISVKAGATINLGNYESARVDVMLSMPVYIEEIDDVYPKVKAWVDERLAEEYQELKTVAGKR